MAQTIEAFVNRLQADGVEAGQAEAEKVRAQAEQQAQTRLAEAAEEAKRIVARAQTESETIRGRAETELKLAARDTVVRLQEALSRVLQTVLVNAVRGKLEDADFLGGLIRDVVHRYVEADAAGSGSIAVHVSEEMRQHLLSGTVDALRPDAPGAKHIDLRGTLAEVGFAYEIAGGTVEVTVDSVVEVLSEMVGAELRKRVAVAAGQ
jgi:vacuolar-type H+-ATPase subunit H